MPEALLIVSFAEDYGSQSVTECIYGEDIALSELVYGGYLGGVSISSDRFRFVIGGSAEYTKNNNYYFIDLDVCEISYSMLYNIATLI